jgi:hypothetical protein
VIDNTGPDWISAEGIKIVTILRAAAMALFVAALCSPAQAEIDASGVSSADEKIINALKQERERGAKNGIVIIDAAVYVGKSYCGQPQVTFGRMVDGKLRAATTHMPGFFTRPIVGMKAAAAGEYHVLRVTCTSGYRQHMNFNGPHAKFQVRAGEVVNVGTLRLDYESDGLFKTTGTLHRSVTPLSPKIASLLKERLPQTTSRMANRPMTVSAAVTRVERPGLFGFSPKHNPTGDYIRRAE